MVCRGVLNWDVDFARFYGYLLKFTVVAENVKWLYHVPNVCMCASTMFILLTWYYGDLVK